MSKIYISTHPVIQHKLTLLRDKRTTTKVFRELVEEISALLVFEASSGLQVKETDVETPFTSARGNILDREVSLIAILRAGLGMVPGALKVFPNAHIGHFGIYRDPKTLEPVEYYAKYFGKIKENNIIVLDPILATGGTANKAIDLLKKKGAASITLVCILASKQGIDNIKEQAPDVPIYLAAVDPVLNEQGYIFPGLGDAGDRIYGTT